MKSHHHSTSRPFQPSAFRPSGFFPAAFRLFLAALRPFQPSAFRLSGFLLLAFFSLQAFSPSAFPQTPPLPSTTGTYYFIGRDYSYATERYVYVSASGTYYYVDVANDAEGVTTPGGRANFPITSPYRVIVTAASVNFQFYNAHAELYTVVTGSTDTGWIPDAGATGISYAARSGTWYASDVTFSLTTASQSAIWAVGYTYGATGTFAHPVTFSGTNVNAIVEHATASSRQAVSLRNGATGFFYGGILSKTVTSTDTGSSEAIYLVGNQEGRGSSSHFYGEDLTIIANGPNIGAITMANGNNTFTLKNSSITSITSRDYTSQAISLADTQSLGGNHFYGENLVITNNSGRLFAFGNGDNSITLVGSTVLNDGRGAAFGWNATTASTRRRDTVGSTVTLEDCTIATTANYAPIFQMIGDWGAATVTSSTLTTDGIGSTILRLVAQNDNTDRTKFDAVFLNSTLEASRGSVIDINVAAADNGNYGQSGGGGKNLTTVVLDSYKILIESSTLTGAAGALRIGAAGRHDSPYGERTDILIHNSVFAGGIEMIAGGGINETSGAYLTITASNSLFTGGMRITGTEAALYSNQAVLHLYNSTWLGDISLTNRGILILHNTSTPIDGALSLSGSSWVELRLTDSYISDGINIAGSGTLVGEALGSSAIGPLNATGGFTDLALDRIPTAITAAGSASVFLGVKNAAAIPGNIHLSGSAFLGLTLRDSARLTSDITVLDRATFAASTSRNETLAIDGNISLAGIWLVTGKTRLDGSLAISDPLGAIHIENATHDSLTLTNGLSGNGRLDILSVDRDTLGASEIRVIHDLSGAFTSATSDPLILSHPFDYGLAAYTLENRPDGAWLVGGLDSGSYGAGGAAVFNSQALAIEDWFAALAPLNYRLAQLRMPGGDASASPARARNNTGSVWLQGRADTTRVNRSGSALHFTSRTYGLTAGVDTRKDYAAATLTTGLFADAARTIRDFIGPAEGLATSAGGGAYAHYQHRGGLHVSAIARFDVYETTLDTKNALNAMRANYHSQAGGAALEAGWRFDLGSGWWLEPAAHVSFASLPGVSYTTKSDKPGNDIPISTSDARATQWLGRVAVGKVLHKNWQLRGHLAFAGTRVSGGEFTVPGLDTALDFTITGTRAEASLGIMRLIGRTGRLTLDASYTTASDYKRPCSIFASWAMGW